jgi:Holliday junction DNA helicase RuvA
MRTKMTGTLTRVLDDEARVQVGPFEYQVMIAEAVRRQMQLHIGKEITLHLSEYLEGGPNANRFIPRLIGFPTEAELQFFDLFCTVDKIGVKKALRAMSRGVREIAGAIHRQDAKWLTTLPGIGPSTAEQIVATLKRKVTPFAFASGEVVDAEETQPEAEKKPRTKRGAIAVAADLPKVTPTAKLIDDLYQAMIGLGVVPAEASEKLDKLLQSGESFTDAATGLELIFRNKM